MAHVHDRLTKHFGKDGKEPKKISHEFAREKALNFLGVMEMTFVQYRKRKTQKL